MNKRRYLLISAIPLTIVLSLLFLSGDSRAPQIAAANGDTIPGRYIVVLKDTLDSTSVARALDQHTDVHPDVVYTSALNGFAAEMTDAEAQGLASNPNVLAVEPDRTLSIDLHTNSFQTLTEGPDRIDLEENATANVTNQPNGTQLDIDVAVIDTGVVTTHPEINVAGGKGFSGSGCSDAGYEDDNGHGSHVSGTIAARDNDRGLVGVAPGARIWAIKVLNAGGSGSESCVIAGINWVTNRRQEFNDGPGDGDPGINIAVANMSLGGPSGNDPLTDQLCTAIDNSTAAGVIYAVAAGNDHIDSAGFSPAHCLNAVTVSAFGDFDGTSGGLSQTTATFGACPANNNVVHDDEFACFSNFGAAVDIAAPGVDIVSTYPFGGCGPGVPCYTSMSGTSMATPHVAGALALFKIANGYNGPANGPAVMAAFTAAGYTRTQVSSCGFTGDPDPFPEPVLYVGTSCTNGPQITPSSSPTPSPSPSPTRTPSPSPTKTPSPTPSPKPTASPTQTPSPPATPTASPTPTPTPTPTQSNRLQGDANCDNSVTGLDSLQIMLTIGNLPSSSCSGAQDTNCNGHIDLLDTMLILRYLSGHPSDIQQCPAVGTHV